MFGYVLPTTQRLTAEQKERYGALYCGLCHTLKERYGTISRFLLSYDLTFLAALLTTELAVTERRCIASPHKKKKMTLQTSALELAADCTVIFAYHKVMDNVLDTVSPKKEVYRLSGKILEAAYQKAAAFRPGLARETLQQMESLRSLEKSHCSSLDLPADTFARLLQSIARELPDAAQQRIFSHLLYHLGRWIYLIDALDDLKKDHKSGNYNPILLRFSLEDGKLSPEAREQMIVTLDASVREIAAAAALWDFGEMTPIIEATVYDGLYRVGGAVLDGTFHQQKRKKKEQP